MVLKFHSFTSGRPVFPAPLVKEIVFNPLYILASFVKDKVSICMHDTGCLGLVHWDDPEGWNGEGGGRRVQDGENYVYN